MSPTAAVYLATFSLFVIFAPKRWTIFPVIFTVFNQPYLEPLGLGAFNVHTIQVITAITYVKLAIQGPSKKFNRTDYLLFGVCFLLISQTIFRDDRSVQFIFNTKMVITYILVHFAFKRYVESTDSLEQICKFVLISLIPLAIGMLTAKIAFYNPYSIFPSVSPVPMVRNGSIRASGPFAHAILAGTATATATIFCLAIKNKFYRRLGIVTGIAGTFACASSGPLLGLGAGIFSYLLLKRRHLIRPMIRSTPLVYLFLLVSMEASPIYIIAKIDLTGSSTSWYRARLIESAFEHLGEWWLAGTNYTRHWMATGVSFSPNHTDITSHYIQIGIWAGIIPLVVLVFYLVSALRGVTLTTANTDESQTQTIWVFASALFSLTVSMTCVALFDNSVALMLSITGCLSALYSISLQQESAQDQTKAAR